MEGRMLSREAGGWRLAVGGSHLKNLSHREESWPWREVPAGPERRGAPGVRFGNLEKEDAWDVSG